MEQRSTGSPRVLHSRERYYAREKNREIVEKSAWLVD